MNELRIPNFKGKMVVIILSWIALVCSIAEGFLYPLEGDAIWSILISILPCALIALYITFCHKKGKAAFLLPIAFVLLAYCVWIRIDFSSLVDCIEREDTDMIPYLLYLASAVLWVLAAVFTSIKRYERTFILMAVFGELVGEILFLLMMRYYGSFEIAVDVLGNLCLFVALIIFALKAITKVSVEEHELKTLQARFANGKITEEEYQAKRADVIRRL